LVNYALKLTEALQNISKDDVNRLRTAGFSDTAIHDAAAITAYFNFVNRLASGLGVELEQQITSG
jgi:alkylhydroperoxidase family enzyme